MFECLCLARKNTLANMPLRHKRASNFGPRNKTALFAEDTARSKFGTPKKVTVSWHELLEQGLTLNPMFAHNMSKSTVFIDFPHDWVDEHPFASYLNVNVRARVL